MSPNKLYSWQEPKAIYNMTLDVEAIGKERANLVELPDPVLLTDFPDELSSLFIRPMSYPSDHNEQDLFGAENNFYEQLGASGTIVYMPSCDRLTYAKAKTLVDHAVKEMARVYRRQIAAGLNLYINNQLVEAFDPTYSMPSARHARFLETESKQSKLIISKPVKVRIHENSVETAPIVIKFSSSRSRSGRFFHVKPSGTISGFFPSQCRHRLMPYSQAAANMPISRSIFTPVTFNNGISICSSKWVRVG